jgi:hypothetical protein
MTLILPRTNGRGLDIERDWKRPLEEADEFNIKSNRDGQVNGKLTATHLDNGGAVYNVQASSAVGDGVTDDTVAIQSVMGAGRTLLFPAGSYLVTDQLVIDSTQVWVFEAGAELITDATFAFEPVVLVSADDVILRNLNINGNTNDHPGLEINGCDRVRVEGGLIVDAYGRGVLVANCEHVTLTGLRVLRCGEVGDSAAKGGIRVEESSYVNVIDCSVIEGWGKGIATYHLDYGLISGCTVLNPEAETSTGIYIRGSNYVIVTDCHISLTPPTFYPQDGVKFSRRAHGCVLQNSTIHCNVPAGSGAAVLFQGVTDCRLVNCSIKDVNRRALVLSDHPDATDGGPTTRTSIIGNLIEETGDDGSSCTLFTGDGEIIGNIFQAVQDAVTLIQLTAGRWTIAYNRFEDTPGVVISTANSPSDLIVENNRALGILSTFVHTRANNTIVRGNHVEGDATTPPGRAVDAVIGTDGLIVSDNVFAGFGVNGVGIIRSRFLNTVITGNIIRSDSTTGVIGIHVDVNASGGVIANNQFVDVDVPWTKNAAAQYSFNNNFVDGAHQSTGRGTATISNGNTSTTVNHGLGFTPVTAVATARSVEAVAITARNSSTITISRAGTTGDLGVDWAAEI